MGVVFDKAEAAGCLLEAVEAHNKALDLADFGKEFMDLLFGGVERPESTRQHRPGRAGGRATYRFPT